MAAAALWELTELILINQLKLIELQKNRDAAANFGCSGNFNGVNGNYGDQLKNNRFFNRVRFI